MNIHVDPGAVESAMSAIGVKSEMIADLELTKKGEAYAANALSLIPIFEPEGDDLLLVKCRRDSRVSMSVAIDGLIAMLDAMEDDPDMEDTGDNEPILGAPERHPRSSWTFGHETRAARRDHSQDDWAAGERYACDREDEDDREQVSEDEGAITGDDEPSLGWQDEGSQESLQGAGADYEASLGSTEEIDQVRRVEQYLGIVHDGEQDICDEPHDEDTDLEPEIDGGDEDFPFDAEGMAHVPGGGSVSQYDDGWRRDPSYLPPVKKPVRETARRLPSGDVVRSYGWNAAGVGNLPPEAMEGVIHEIRTRH